jgi:TolA-binding protein
MEKPKPRKKIVWTKRAALLVAAALLFVSGVAAAQSGVATRVWQTVGAVFDPPPPPMVLNVPPIVVTAPAPPKKEEPPPASPPKVEEEPKKVEKRIEARVEPPKHEEIVPPPAPAPTAVEVETPSSVFERANAARRRGDVAGALAAYRELQSRHGSSAEARLSVALLARMQLDRGDAAGALAGFEAYLRTGDGSLREEAMAGRALALQRLGRISEARQAWSDLLRAYPRSAYARFAEKLNQDPG